MSNNLRPYNYFPSVDSSVALLSPGEGFTRVPLPRGVGIHCGGVFRSPDKKYIYKPLDCRDGHQNNAPRLRTQEDVVLDVMAGAPGFPRNWHVEQKNGREWLVRPACLTIPGTFPLAELREAHVLEIEAGLRALNEKNWDLGDGLEVAIDPQTRLPFLLDLSCSLYRGPKCSDLYRDDSSRFDTWVETVGFAEVSRFRWDARHIVESVRFHYRYPKEYTHVYATTSGPFTRSSELPGALLIEADRQKSEVWTWIVLPVRLDVRRASDLGLIWGWSPLASDETETAHPFYQGIKRGVFGENTLKTTER